MANHREVLNDRFIAFSGEAKKQSAWDTPLANADIDTRDKCTITREDTDDYALVRDCKDEGIVAEELKSRITRFTLTYNEVTPQIMARWTAYYLGASFSPTGTPADETQTLARTGTVSGGTFTIAITLEGRTVTTKPIAWDATPAQIQSALTAARMLFIGPGSVVVTGDWTAGIVLTFGGNLAKANIPSVVIDATLLTGTTPDISVTPSNGAQNDHVLSRSSSRGKALLSFILGWDNASSANDSEKYINYVVDQLSASESLDGNVTFTVQLLGPTEYDSLEPAYTIPACENIDPLQAQDCRISIDGVWQTTDINTLSVTVADNVPTDRLSAFPFDGIDVQTLERGRQPAYGPITASVFGSETDTLYQLALNARTEDPVPVILHFGFPGDRLTWNFPKTKVRFQTNRLGEAGEARYSTIQITGQPFNDGTNPPFNAEAFVDQSVQFLLT